MDVVSRGAHLTKKGFCGPYHFCFRFIAEQRHGVKDVNETPSFQQGVTTQLR